MASTPAVPGKLVAGSIVRTPDGKGNEVDAVIFARYEPYDLSGGTERSARILSLIESGEILVNENTVVRAQDNFLVYTKLTAVTFAAMVALTDGPVDLVLNEDGKPAKGKDSVAASFNYGKDLDAKAWVGGQFRKSNEDPRKAIDAAIEKASKIKGLSPEKLAALEALLRSE